MKTDYSSIATNGTVVIPRKTIEQLPAPANIFSIDVALRKLLQKFNLPMTSDDPPDYRDDVSYEIHQDPQTQDLIYEWRQIEMARA